MKRERHYSGETRRALKAMGTLIAVERRTQRWRQSELAERAGISVATLIKIERGAPGTEIGSAFELATILGIRLFPQVDDVNLAQRLALAPGRVDTRALVGDDDF